MVPQGTSSGAGMLNVKYKYQKYTPSLLDELDMDGTRVSPVAYEPPSRPRNVQARPVMPSQLPPAKPTAQPASSA